MSTTRKKGVTLQDLQKTEHLLDVILDPCYQELFQLVNAPEFGEWLFYPIKDRLNLRKTFDDVVRNSQIAHGEGLPKEYIVIAENGTGNYLCMLSGQPQIYHKDHEQDLPRKIAPDLKTFIQQAENFN
ncbi:SMI1/KNR4 family protein [Carnobacterium gallinarum]|uniref:SMI1/KNR4 family protein n=1 Tax=Carnobacterium gallinarum TaxID=2749 RepID=UPI0005508BFE|nr:SMI1/KNR4 family protein [Carnobacterium gallinarum]